ncbi:MAG TPA: class I SAM-dependent methyltransferase [Kofleriaceae bacterium]
MTEPNADMIEYWNGDGGKRWTAQPDRIDRAAARINEALFAFAAPHAGEHVLDLGCGCGSTTIELARRTGVAAVGVDVSAPMLEIARARGGATYVAGDASVHAFAAEFELVFSRFGVMFFADPVAAFANIRRALAPGGRLAFACWRAMEHNAWAGVPLAAARPLLPPQSAPEPHAPGPFALADGERLRGILERAGWHDVTLTAHASTMWLGESLDEALDDCFEIGPLARLAAQLPEDTRARIRERLAPALAPFVTAGGVAVPAAVWLVGAK